MSGQDLSQFHRPMNDLFVSSATERERQQWKLSEEQIAFFHEHGFVAGPKILTDQQVDQLRKELETLTEPGHPGSEFW